MLHTKFRENQPAGSGKKIFIIYGRGGHLGHVTRILLSSPLPMDDMDI